MKVLITGASGFVGRHLSKELVSSSHTVIALDLHFKTPLNEAEEVFTADLQNHPEIAAVIKKTMPDACVHLGGMSFVPAGNSDPDLMHSINCGGTINLLESIREHAPECRTLVVSTAQVYGPDSTDTAVTEETPLAPSTTYSRTKAEADNTALNYAMKHKMHIMTARPNNHTGPGQSPQFVVSSFAKQVKAISRNEQEPLISVGNLESIRDFSDVRDVVHAYRLLLEKGRSGEAYNISARNMIPIQKILDTLCELTGVSPRIEVDPEKFRPTDSSPFLDTSKIEADTGWNPVIPIDQTLKDMLESF